MAPFSANTDLPPCRPRWPFTAIFRPSSSGQIQDASKYVIHVLYLTSISLFRQIFEFETSANRCRITLRKRWRASSRSVSCISWIHQHHDDRLLVATADLKITVWSSDGEWIRVLGCPMKLPLCLNAASENRMAIIQNSDAQQKDDSTYRTTTRESWSTALDDDDISSPTGSPRP